MKLFKGKRRDFYGTNREHGKDPGYRIYLIWNKCWHALPNMTGLLVAAQLHSWKLWGYRFSWQAAHWTLLMCYPSQGCTYSKSGTGCQQQAWEAICPWLVEEGDGVENQVASDEEHYCWGYTIGVHTDRKKFRSWFPLSVPPWMRLC